MYPLVRLLIIVSLLSSASLSLCQPNLSPNVIASSSVASIGSVAEASYQGPQFFAWDGASNLYMTDISNNIFIINDNVPNLFASSPLINSPQMIVWNPTGNVLIIANSNPNLLQIPLTNNPQHTVSIFVESDLFNFPQGITMYGGYYYVTQANGNTVVEISFDGKTIQLFSDTPLLSSPQGIIYWNNYLYVNNANNDDLLQFSLDGTQVQIATSSSLFSSPQGMTIFNGSLVIVNGANNMVFFSPNGTVSTWGYNALLYNNAQGVILDSTQQNFLIANLGFGNILTVSGSIPNDVSILVDSTAPFQSPAGVAFVYPFAYSLNANSIIATNVLDTLSSLFATSPLFNSPYGITYNDVSPQFYVCNYLDGNLLTVSMSGEVSIAITSALINRPYSLVYSAYTNNLFVSNNNDNNILVVSLTKTGTPTQVNVFGQSDGFFNNPTGIILGSKFNEDNQKNLYVMNRGLGDIVQVDLINGNSSTFVGSLVNPAWMAWDDSTGTAYIVSSTETYIYQFNLYNDPGTLYTIDVDFGASFQGWGPYAVVSTNLTTPAGASSPMFIATNQFGENLVTFYVGTPAAASTNCPSSSSGISSSTIGLAIAFSVSAALNIVQFVYKSKKRSDTTTGRGFALTKTDQEV